MTTWTRLEKIGSGSTGEVWRVQDEHGRLAALKQVVDIGAAHQYHSLKVEIEALAGLNHPHIPRLIESDLTAERPYLVMTLAEGEALNVLIASGKLWEHPLELRLNALDSLADAIAHLHERGLIHRDIKPSNMRGLHHPQLLDFGLACSIGHVNDPDAGTSAYMPPFGEVPSPTADHYAFAVSVYHLLFGAHPTRDHHRKTFQTAQDRAADAAAFASGDWRRPTMLPPSSIPGDLRESDLIGLEQLFIPAFSADSARRPADLRAWLAQIRGYCLSEASFSAHKTTLPAANDIPFIPPPALPDFTAQQAAGFDDTRPPNPPRWWARIFQRLKGVTLFRKAKA